ncbi:HAD-like domain-containing protein [Chytriomyces sp. MP71]|nr:HAD-like domain-containing protein [Chytriomyces sp. MP71]
MHGRIRLVTFDAWNTLFRLKHSVGATYLRLLQHKLSPAEQRALNLDRVRESDISQAFGAAFKRTSAEHAHFGRELGSYQKWWTLVLQDTFAQVGAREPLSQATADLLIGHFASAEPYVIEPTAATLLRHLRESGITVGVISNSDPRTVQALDALGLGDFIDFVVTQFEVGFAKPDPRIFKLSLDRAGIENPALALHAGDDLERDLEGPIACGWNAALLENASLADTILKRLEVLQ